MDGLAPVRIDNGVGAREQASFRAGAARGGGWRAWRASGRGERWARHDLARAPGGARARFRPPVAEGRCYELPGPSARHAATSAPPPQPRLTTFACTTTPVKVMTAEPSV